MLKLTRQQQYILVLVAGLILLGSAFTVWWQQREPDFVVDSLSPVEAATPQGESPQELVVHVTGAVVSQGVYRLPEGSRVVDALAIAGGGTEKADIHALNLAALVFDQQRIFVPTTVETMQNPSGTSGVGGQKLLNLNLATQAELETLPGIGPTLAGRIIAYRESQGPFTKVDDLIQVSGIGAKTMEQLRDLVTAP